MKKTACNRPQALILGILSLTLCTTVIASERHHHHHKHHFEARSIDGYGNNRYHPEYGNAEIPLLRKSGVGYEDKISSPAGADRPNPRDISNIVAAQLEEENSRKRASAFVWQWGQFLDHDIDLTPDVSGEFFPISIPRGDQWFDPFSTGQVILPLVRSVYTGGTSKHDPRQQLNVITAFIDASNVYGSDEVRALALRTFEDGKLKTSSNGRFLPFNEYGLPNAGGDEDEDLYLAGDIRANEQIGLTAMHTLFVREHNRLCDIIKRMHPRWGDERIYQYARKIVGAQMQVITYNEFLPMILGKRHKLPKYRGYDKTINPGINNEFSTAAFRFGHSMLNETIILVDPYTHDETELPLAQAFFNAELLEEIGDIDPVLLGLARMSAQEIDNKVVNAVRNFLFGPPGAGGLDLVAMNIQRGREHGLANYNQVRKAYGLKKNTKFKHITHDKNLQQKLKQAYGKTKYLDVWVAGLAEDHVRGAMVGETFHTILSDQFRRLRDGDRFWYAHDRFFKTRPWLKSYVERTRLSDIIIRNTSLTRKDLPKNVFKREHK